MSYVKRLIETRASAWEEAKTLLDSASAENRDLTGEEQASYDRIMADLDSRAEQIRKMRADEDREAEIDRLVAGSESQVRSEPPAAQSDMEKLRALARGEMRSAMFMPEQRAALAKTSTGAPVPTSFYDQVIMKARYAGPMLDVATILNTASGENLQIPRMNAYSSGTVTSEGSTFGAGEPTFSAFVTLGAFKYSFLAQLSSELVADEGVDILGFLADQTGNALGYAVNTVLTTGTDTTEPNGIVTASALGVTGGTGVSGAATFANLVDLVYSADAAARRLPGFGVMANATSIAAFRKLQDGAGSYVFQPSLAEGTPDRLLGFPLIENPAVADPAVNAKSIIAGDLKSYFVRQVGGIRLDRSDDYAFAADQVTFRAQIRVDGDLPQTSHVKHFVGGTA